jgi:hypothetical protein
MAVTDKRRDESSPISETVGQVVAAMMAENFREILSRTVEKAMMKVVDLETLKGKRFLTEEEVSRLFSIPVASLRSERSRKTGPDYIKDGRRVLYPQVELLKYYSGRLVRLRGGD